MFFNTTYPPSIDMIFDEKTMETTTHTKGQHLILFIEMIRVTKTSL